MNILYNALNKSHCSRFPNECKMWNQSAFFLTKGFLVLGSNSIFRDLELCFESNHPIAISEVLKGFATRQQEQLLCFVFCLQHLHMKVYKVCKTLYISKRVIAKFQCNTWDMCAVQCVKKWRKHIVLCACARYRTLCTKVNESDGGGRSGCCVAPSCQINHTTHPPMMTNMMVMSVYILVHHSSAMSHTPCRGTYLGEGTC